MRRLFAGFAIGLTAFIAVGPAYAASSTLNIDRVDSQYANDTQVHVVMGGQPGDGVATKPDFQLSENGHDARIHGTIRVVDSAKDGNPDALKLKSRSVLVIDSSLELARGDHIDEVKKAGHEVVNGMAGNDWDTMSVIGVAGTNQAFQAFQKNKSLLNSQIDELDYRSGRDLNGAVNLAVDQLHDVDGDVKNIVIISGGGSATATPSMAELRTKIQGEGINVFVLGLKGDAGDVSSLSQYVAAAGTYREVDIKSDLASAGVKLRSDLDNQWILRYNAGDDDVVQIKVTGNGASDSATFRPGQITTGENLKAQFTKPNKLIRLIPLPSPNLARLIIAAMFLVAVGITAWVIGQVIDRRTSLQSALRPYANKQVSIEEDKDTYLNNALMKRAVEATEQMARDRGFLNTVENKLYQADMTLNAAEFIFLSIACTLLAGGAGFALNGIGAAIVCLIVVGAGIPVWLNFKGARRRRKFEGQLPDALQLLAGSLRAGYSLLQGIDATSQQVEEPMGKELRQAMAEAQLGRPIEDALGEVADRVQSIDFRWTVMAMKIQRQVGGNLAEVLMNVSDTIVQRERLRREIRTLTAEGRISAIILLLLPPGMFMFLLATNRTYIDTMLNDSFGKLVLVLAGIFMLVGVGWIKKMLKLDL